MTRRRSPTAAQPPGWQLPPTGGRRRRQAATASAAGSSASAAQALASGRSLRAVRTAVGSVLRAPELERPGCERQRPTGRFYRAQSAAGSADRVRRAAGTRRARAVGHRPGWRPEFWFKRAHTGHSDRNAWSCLLRAGRPASAPLPPCPCPCPQCRARRRRHDGCLTRCCSAPTFHRQAPPGQQSCQRIKQEFDAACGRPCWSSAPPRQRPPDHAAAGPEPSRTRVVARAAPNLTRQAYRPVRRSRNTLVKFGQFQGSGASQRACSSLPPLAQHAGSRRRLAVAAAACRRLALFQHLLAADAAHLQRRGNRETLSKRRHSARWRRSCCSCNSWLPCQRPNRSTTVAPAHAFSRLQPPPPSQRAPCCA